MNFQNLTIFNQHPDGQQQQMARNENSATKCRWQKNKKTNAKYSLSIKMQQFVEKRPAKTF